MQVYTCVDEWRAPYKVREIARSLRNSHRSRVYLYYFRSLADVWPLPGACRTWRAFGLRFSADRCPITDWLRHQSSSAIERRQSSHVTMKSVDKWLETTDVSHVTATSGFDIARVVVLILVLEEKSLVVSLFLVFFRGIHKVVFCETSFQTHITCKILLTCIASAVIVCGMFPFHFSQVFCINLNAWNVHTDVTTFAQVLVLVLVLGEKSLLTSLDIARCRSDITLRGVYQSVINKLQTAGGQQQQLSWRRRTSSLYPTWFDSQSVWR